MVPDDKIRDELVRLKTIIGQSYMDMGRYLFRVHSLRLFQKWGHATFDVFVDTDLDMHPRKARYLIGIWKRLRIECGAQEDDMAGVSWAKAREVQKVATPENVGQWLERARNVSARTLEEEVRQAKEKTGGDKNAATDPKPASEVEHLRRFAVNMYPDQWEILSKAMEIAGVRANSDKDCHKLACIAQEFCVYSTPEDPGKRLEWYIKMLEGSFRVKLEIAKNEPQPEAALEPALRDFERRYGVKLLAFQDIEDRRACMEWWASKDAEKPAEEEGEKADGGEETED
jgi:hypothetical protein